MHRILLLLLCLLPTTLHAAEKLQIVASFSILADMARNVAGNRAEVTSLVPVDADGHTYEPTPADARRLAHADLVLINGLNYEGWIKRLIEASGYRGSMITATAHLPSIRMDDPHAWQSARLAKTYIENIRDALVQRDPDHRADYEANASAMLTRLAGLDTKAHKLLDAIPADQRQVMTTHDAFGYFADEYHVTFLSALGGNTDHDATAADLAYISRAIKQGKVKAVFLENVTDNRLVKALRSDGAYLGGTLYSDALSAPNGPAPTYEKMFEHNLRTLINGMRHNR